MAPSFAKIALIATGTAVGGYYVYLGARWYLKRSRYDGLEGEGANKRARRRVGGDLNTGANTYQHTRNQLARLPAAFTSVFPPLSPHKTDMVLFNMGGRYRVILRAAHPRCAPSPAPTSRWQRPRST